MKIAIRNLQRKIPIYPRRIKKAILNVLSSEGMKKSGEITICFVDDKRIKELNSRYTGRNEPTDVLAFDITERNDKSHILAEIAVSTDAAMRNALSFNTSPSYELKLYVIHGILHLLGYSDKGRRQRRIMQQKEGFYVNK